MLRVVVLGAAAGGGVPQWNCGCSVCAAARTDPELQSTQASIAISADDDHWFLINTSPDLRQQLIATPQLHPKAGKLRHSPISGVILTNGEIDAIAGLLSMREGSPFTIYAHEKVLSILKANSIFNVLNDKNVRRQPIELDKAFEPTLPVSWRRRYRHRRLLRPVADVPTRRLYPIALIGLMANNIAPARIGELGFQREVDQMIDYARRNLPDLDRIEVELHDRYELGDEPALVIEAYGRRPFDPADLMLDPVRPIDRVDPRPLDGPAH